MYGAYNILLLLFLLLYLISHLNSTIISEGSSYASEQSTLVRYEMQAEIVQTATWDDTPIV